MTIVIEEHFDIAIVHGPCSDGTGSAWAARKRFPGIKIFENPAGAGLRKEILDEVVSKNVLVADLFPKVEDLHEVVKKAKRVLILDHHASAVKQSEKLSGLLSEEEAKRCTVFLDMTRSGCKITWETLFPEKEGTSWVIDYLEDADLYKFQLPFSKEINCYLSSEMSGKTLNEKLDFLQEMSMEETSIQDFVSRGKAILTYRDNQIKEIANKAEEYAFFVKSSQPTIHRFWWYPPSWFAPKQTETMYRVWGAPSPCGEMISDLGNVLAHKHFEDGTKPDFVFIWSRKLTGTGVKLSLRGSDSSPDLSKIAIEFGGGGHPKASGCFIQNTWEIIIPWDERPQLYASSH